MQLFSRNKALAALSLGALAALGACGDDVTVPAPVNPPVAVTISPSNANVNVGASVDLAVAITGGASTPTLASCSTSSAAVATVAVQGGTACRVTGVSTGAVTITATTSGGQAAAASVTVNAPAPAISGIAISPAAQNVQVGGTFAITANPTTTAPGATVARGFVSSNNAVATVSATGTVTAVAPGQATITVTLTGTGTGLSQAVVTGQVAVTVVANPPAVTGVSVTPSSAAMVVGAAPVTGTATATAATGITPTFTAGSSNPGVATATVTSAGAFTITAVGAGQAVITITAQSAGNASFAAASATAQIPVTVNAAAQVAIANITSATSNNPVDINSVSGQIQVALNLTTNNNVVRAVRLFVCPVNGTCPTTPAAEQTFGAAGAANGQINMFINTADFTVASDWSSATTRFANGQQNIVAQLDVASAAANNTLAILNLTNTDGFAARHVAPTRAVVAVGSSTSGANGLTYYGGPSTAGRGSATIVPVIYTAGRTITTATAEITGAACNNTDITFTGAGPWTITYGASADTVANRVIGCSGTSSTTPDLGISVLSAVDNAQNSMTIPGSFRTNSSNTPAVTAPAIIRADYQAPSGAALAWASQNGASSNWVNAAFKFDSAGTAGTAGAFMTRPTDGGAGLPDRLAIDVQGCPWVDRSTATPTWTTLSQNTGDVVAECATSNANNVYEARYISVDRLGNSVTSSGIVYSGRFGVDKTAPAVRYGVNTLAQQTIITAVAASNDTIAFQIEALDERSGLNASPASAGDHYLVRALRGGTAARAGECVAGSYPSTSPATTNAGGAFITAPNCVMGAISGSYAGITTDGFSRFPAVSIGQDAYYTYRARVRDEAGNVATTDIRNVLLSKSAFASAANSGVAADVMIAPINAAYAGPFTGTVKDSVETRATGLRVRYTNGGSNTVVLGFPLVATTATAFDNTITRDSVFSLATPFTSGVRLYTNLEYVNGADSVVASPASVDTVAASGVFALNFGGKSNSNFASFLTGSVTNDATAWLTKSSAVRAFFMDTLTIAAYNAPATGLRARVRGSLDLANSPFARVDFYRVLTSGTWEYVGSVTGNGQPCISASSSCDVYIAENVSERTFTYVLRTSATGAESFAATSAGGLGSGSYRAIGVSTSAGRGLVTRDITFDAAPSALRR